ncbi:MAG: ABC transporter ATP-binding protein [Actinomycetota bacterium]|nr:ABC transporter ATP-binding protein [Actinomycetota bacterium]
MSFLSSAADGARPLLAVRDLRVSITAGTDTRPILHGVDFEVARGEAVSLVGESGAGKSMTARAVARLLPHRASCQGRIELDGVDLTSLNGAALRQARLKLGVVFQDPRAQINPVRRIGDFLTEQLRLVRKVPRREAELRARQMLSEVGIDDAARRMRQYPSDLSGGMLQRVMIASVLLGEPELILADEPTTALDVTTQSEVLAILDELRRDRGLALLFITHDLDLAAAVCDRTIVMYAGQIVEQQPARALHQAPLHPYTAALCAARPNLDSPRKRLVSVPGSPLAAWDAGIGCAFGPRCSYRLDECDAAPIPLTHDRRGDVRCIRSAELSSTLEAVR